MTKLNQIIGLAQGRKARSESVLTEIYHKFQNKGSFAGQKRTYRPKDDEGDIYPGEEKRLQLRSEALLQEAASVVGDTLDVVATQDWANCSAKADVKVAGVVIVAELPPTFLCFLERQLVNFKTQLSALPLLDPEKEWEYSVESDCNRSKPTERVKTKKVPKITVGYEATKEHPAQLIKDVEDVVEGYWTTVDFSGAVSAARKRELLDRVVLLIEAVRSAREEANCLEVAQVRVADRLFAFILEGKTETP